MNCWGCGALGHIRRNYPRGPLSQDTWRGKGPNEERERTRPNQDEGHRNSDRGGERERDRGDERHDHDREWDGSGEEDFASCERDRD